MKGYRNNDTSVAMSKFSIPISVSNIILRWKKIGFLGKVTDSRVGASCCVKRQRSDKKKKKLYTDGVCQGAQEPNIRALNGETSVILKAKYGSIRL